MRHPVVIAVLVCVSILATPAFARVAIGTNVTVLLNFDGQFHPETLAELKQETSVLLKRTGIRLELRLRQDALPNEEFEDVVLVRFHGTCRMENFAPLLDERGPYAWTHAVANDILPFSEVACDKVRQSIERAIWGGARAKRDQLLGRALARVLAHELYHILGQTHQHGTRGIAKASLSGEQLIADNVEFAPEDCIRLQRRR